jgi:predicted site-specific integrase-resolvase
MKSKLTKTNKAALPRMAYSLKETAQVLGVAYLTAWRLTRRGLLKSSGSLGKKLIPITEIERFLKDTTK